MSIRNKFMLEPARAVLLVIDVQEKLCAAMDRDALRLLTKNAGILLESANELSIPVLFTEQYVKGLGPTLPELRGRAPAVPCHEKLTFSCCGNDMFVRQLKDSGRTQVIVSGMEAHVCVLQTALDGVASGRRIWVAADAVTSRRVANRETGLAQARQAGAMVSATESILFGLLGEAATDAFRAVAKLVK